MIFLIRKPVVLAAALMAIGLLGTSARADLTVTVEEDAGPVKTFTVAGLPSSNLSVTAGDPGTPGMVVTPDYRIRVLGGGADQTSTTVGLTTTNVAKLQGSSTSITNTTGHAGHVLHITISGTLYSLPTAPPSIGVNSHIGTTVSFINMPSTNSFAYQSFVNATGFGSQNPAINTKTAANNDVFGSIASLSAPFTIKETFAIVLNGRQDQINFSSSTTLTQTTTQQVVPEPSTLAIAGLGALGMIGYGLRRRKALGA